MTVIRLAVIDREGFYIDAVMAVLDQQPDMSVVATLTASDDLPVELQEAEVVILQQESPQLTRKLVGEIVGNAPDCSVVVFGADDHIPTLVSFIEAGAIGYVRKSEPFERLLQMVRIVASGETMVDPELVAPLCRRLAELGRAASRYMPARPDRVELTERQQEVMDLLAREMTNQEIADALGISVGTVKNHLHKIFTQLQVRSREEAALMYARMQERSENPAMIEASSSG